MKDPSLQFLQQFVALYQETLDHDGYSDIEVRIRLVKGKGKEVRLFCGKEYRYLIPTPKKTAHKTYQVIDPAELHGKYTGPERRTGISRRQHSNQRRKANTPRHFKLERRVNSDRRSGRGRRHDD